MREGDVRKLEQSQLALVLCQVRFSPLERMEHYAPFIQDALRKHGYPLNRSHDISELRWDGTAPRQLLYRQWQLHDVTNQHAIILGKGFLTLQTTSYDTFEPFLQRLCDALDIVNEIVEGLLVERVGLRYVNTIVTGVDESWRAYLREGIRGLQSELLLPSSALEVHQTTASTRAGTIAMRLFQNRGASLLPPDLDFNGLRLPPHLDGAQDPRLNTIVDVDHINLDNFSYDRARLEESAWRLKKITYQLTFDEIFTPYAVTQWQQTR